MIAKEFRALLPAWLACAAAMIASAGEFYAFRGFGVPAYFIGAGSLGALSIGHEYSYGTLGMLLSQPIDRRRVLLTKLGVLAVMHAALLGVAMATTELGRGERFFGAVFFWLPILVSLFVAPWLTMVSRMPVAGAVFSVAIVGFLLLAGQWLGVLRHGYTTEVDTFRLVFLWWSLLALCTVGAVMTWRTFLRLETVDGPRAGPGIRMRAAGAVASTTGVTKRNPVWLLLMKELRLQQLAFAIAGVYVTVYVLLVTLAQASSELDDRMTILTIFYSGLLAMLIGSLASAEERQLGTREWQLLMPMAAWRQWAVKAGTVLALSSLLGIALPWLLVSLLPPEHLTWFQRSRPFVQPKTFVLILGLASGSLYISSLSAGGLWALILSVPATFGVGMFLASASRPIERAVYQAGFHGGSLSLPYLATNALFPLVFAALLLMILRYGLVNHHSADRSTGRILGQVAWMAAWTVVGLTTVLVLGAM